MHLKYKKIKLSFIILIIINRPKEKKSLFVKNNNVSSEPWLSEHRHEVQITHTPKRNCILLKKWHNYNSFLFFTVAAI